jgi:hypothetical protein
MNDQKNMLIAIGLSALVLIVWQYFIGMPQMEKQRQEAQLKQQQQQQQTTQTPGAPGAPAAPAQPGAAPQAQVPGQPAAIPGQAATREAIIAASPRVTIDTPNIKGSIALKGARIDDIALIRFRETVDPKSPPIVLLAPSGSPHPFYAEFGWVAGSGTKLKLPNADTVWTQQGSGPLAVGRPVTLTYDNGEGLEFRRVITVDERFLFTVEDSVANRTDAPVSLFPYALISRHGGPDRRPGRAGPQGGHLFRHREGEGDDLQGLQRLVRHHRQILGGDAPAGNDGEPAGALLLRRAGVAAHIPDRLPARSDHGRTGRDRRRQGPPVRRRQGSGGDRQLRPHARPQPLRIAD